MNIELNQYKIISFDIFDTLILRTVEKPIDVFGQMWLKAKQREVAKTDLSEDVFIKIRLEMEKKARNKSVNSECTLWEIYQEFPDYIIKNKKEALNLEIETEKECCYLNFDMYELLQQAKKSGKIIILISDMYLDSEQMKELLISIGFDWNLVDAVFISNEYKVSKQMGQLFEEFLKKYPNIKKEEILHIGDNKNADYEQAINKGLKAYHYDAIPEKLHSIYDYERIRHNSPLKELLSLRKVVVYNKQKINDTHIQKLAYEIGASIMGPFLTVFVDHVCDRLEELKIKRIYPFMREGYILSKLIKNEAKQRNLDLKVEPIYISRKVSYIPSIEKVNREEIENMIGARNLTIREAIRLMGLDLIDVEISQNYLDLKWKETHKISYESNNLKEYLINQFLKKENIEKIEKYIGQERKLFVSYLTQEINNFEEIATIDIGFFGRIQQWMEKSLELEKKSTKMKHFLAIGVTGDKILQGMDFEGYYSSISENQDLVSTIHRTTDIIEKFISVTEGSTIGYQKKRNRIEPIKAQKVGNDLVTNNVFEGIFDFQEYYFKLREKKPKLIIKIKEKRRETLMILHRLIDMPRLVEAKLIADIEADTNFGTGYKKEIITQENMRLLDEKGIQYIDKCNTSYTYDNSNIVWPKGLITLKDEFYYVRKAINNSAGNEIIKAMQEVVEQVKNEGIKEIALYGAGENGRQFYFMCQLYHIKVNCFIDRKKSLWGTQKEGIKIIGLDEAIQRGYQTFIITSLFSISEIEEFIKEKFQIIPNSNFKIYHV